MQMRRRAMAAGPAGLGGARVARARRDTERHVGEGRRARAGRGGRARRGGVASAVTVRCKGAVCEGERARGVSNSYLPGRGDTMITKVVFPGRGLSIALRMC